MVYLIGAALFESGSSIHAYVSQHFYALWTHRKLSTQPPQNRPHGPVIALLYVLVDSNTFFAHELFDAPINATLGLMRTKRKLLYFIMHCILDHRCYISSKNWIKMHHETNTSKHCGHNRSFPALSNVQSSKHSSCSHLLHAHITQFFSDFFWTSSSYVVKHTQHLLLSIFSATRTFFGGSCAPILVLNVFWPSAEPVFIEFFSSFLFLLSSLLLCFPCPFPKFLF